MTINNNVELIFVEGNIGSGKTTALRKLKENIPNLVTDTFDIIVIEESVDKWNNRLKWFYEHMDVAAKEFELFVASIRIDNLLKILHNIPSNEKIIYVFIERSLWIQKYAFLRLHNETMNTKDLNEIKNKIGDMLSELYGYNRIYLYLRTESEICFNRIQKRGRKGEETITLNFLRLLEKYHDDYLLNKIIIPDKDKCVTMIKVSNDWSLSYVFNKFIRCN